MKIYKYAGDGAGIPGLAHQITEEEAAQFSTQLAQVLKDALAAGTYTENTVGADLRVHPEPASRKTKKADEPPAIGE